MASLKGTDIISIRTLIRKKGAAAEASWLAGLSPETIKIYNVLLPVSWVPLERASEIMETAAQVVYPGEKNAVALLAADYARDHFSGIYKILLPMLTTPATLIQKVSHLWKTFYDTGSAAVAASDVAAKWAVLEVTGIPELTAVNRQFIGAWSAAALGLTHAKHVSVAHEDKDPARWIWRFQWE
jgi:hypothetical protein